MTTLFDTTMPAQAKSNEWYTPQMYIEAAREVMGEIDLDPASCEVANRTVKAKRYYTQTENGLAQEWYGRVWLNPPYGKTSPGNGIGRIKGGAGDSVISWFIAKLLDCYRKGSIKQAILLVTSDTDASWFYPLWEYLICFPTHRVHFHRPGMSNQCQFFGTCFVYLGPHEQKFIDIFSQFGRIARAIDTPCQPLYTPRSLWEVSA